MRNLLYILSAILLVDCIMLIYRRSITLGLAIMFMLTSILFILARYWPFWLKITNYGIGKYVKYSVIFSLCLYAVFITFILSFGRTNVTYDEDAIIVLGCGLNADGTPSNTLKNRLDGCINYWKLNTDAVIVLSGAKSRNSELTEAQGMKNYLLAHGIPEGKILMDENATNTRENFRFSKELLEKNGKNAEKIVFITNSFHCYRSGTYANQEGFDKISRISVKTDIVVYIPAVLRESCGVAAMLLLGY